MEEQYFTAKEGVRIGCPGCGGSLRFDIAKQAMCCNQCGSEYAPERFRDEQRDEGWMETRAFRCPQCGAEIYTAGDTEATGTCLFCGSSVVFASRLSRFRRPEKLIPFRITREQCEEIYRNHLRKYRLIPSSLKQQETVSGFQPVYVPFWQYKLYSEGQSASFLGYQSYTKGNYRYDEKYRLITRVSADDESTLYDASKAFEDETSDRLAFSPQDAVPFRSCYLSGFYAQGADVEAETYQADVKASAALRVMQAIRAKSPLNHTKYIDTAEDAGNDYGLPNASWSAGQVMMPVWLLTSRSGDRVLYTAVNGATGEIVCDPPVQIGRAAVVMLLIAAALFVLFQFTLNLRAPLLSALCALMSAVFQFVIFSVTSRQRRREERMGDPGGTGEADPSQRADEFMAKVKRSARAYARKFGEADKKRAKGAGISFGDLKGSFFFFIPLVIFLLNFLGDGYLPLSSKGLPEMILSGLSLLLLVINLFRKQPDRTQNALRFAAAAAAAVLITLLLTGQFEDWMYYACAIVQLGLALAGMTLTNLKHNRYVSRPVPFFGGEEAVSE